MKRGASIGGDGAARDEDVIARLLVGGGLLRRRRVRRLLLARLLNEARETGEEPEFEEEEEEAGEEGGMSERGIARFLIASGILRRRRMRRMILAHLLRERGEGGEAEFGEHEGFEGYEAEEGGPSSDRKLARFLIVSGILRRRRVRQMVLAHLLRERREEAEPEFGEHEEFGGYEAEEGGPSSGQKLARFLIASGILRRRRVRQMILAHLLRERGEGFEPEFERFGGFEGEEGPSSGRKLARFLIASGILRRRRVRQMILAHLLRERGEFGREAEEMEGEEMEGAEPGWGRGFGRERMHVEGGSAWGG